VRLPRVAREAGRVRDGRLDERDPVGDGRDGRLHPRLSGDQQAHLVELQLDACALGDDEVAQVRRVEGAAHQADATGPRLRVRRCDAHATRSTNAAS
jgi:hypothetical protein